MIPRTLVAEPLGSKLAEGNFMAGRCGSGPGSAGPVIRAAGFFSIVSSKLESTCCVSASAGLAGVVAVVLQRNLLSREQRAKPCKAFRESLGCRFADLQRLPGQARQIDQGLLAPRGPRHGQRCQRRERQVSLEHRLFEQLGIAEEFVVGGFLGHQHSQPFDRLGRPLLACLSGDVPLVQHHQPIDDRFHRLRPMRPRDREQIPVASRQVGPQREVFLAREHRDRDVSQPRLRADLIQHFSHERLANVAIHEHQFQSRGGNHLRDQFLPREHGRGVVARSPQATGPVFGGRCGRGCHHRLRNPRRSQIATTPPAQRSTRQNSVRDAIS